MRIGFEEGEENARAGNNRVRFSIAGICSLYMDRAVIYRAASCGKRRSSAGQLLAGRPAVLCASLSTSTSCILSGGKRMTFSH